MRRFRAPQVTTTRGFTLVELLAVVAMVGILAAIAIVGYRKYVNAAGTSEASAIVQLIRHAETNYKVGEEGSLTYLGCSGCGASGCAPGGGSLTAYYPMATPSSKKYAWDQPAHADYACWRLLHVRTDGAVRFGYAVVAGGPGDSVVTPSGFASMPAFTQPNDHWFVIQAAGDRNENTIPALVAATSWTNEVYIENDTE